MTDERGGRSAPSNVGVDARISRPNAGVRRLVYRSGDDLFAVFVAPTDRSLQFGKYKLIGASIDGMQCSQVQCPRHESTC